MATGEGEIPMSNDFVKVCTGCSQVFTPHIDGGNSGCHKCHLGGLYGKVGACAMCMSPTCTNCGANHSGSSCDKQIEHLFKFGKTWERCNRDETGRRNQNVCKVCLQAWITHNYATCKGTAPVPKPSVPSSKPIPPTPILSLTSSDTHEFYPCQVRLVSDAHGMRAQFPQQISYNEQNYHISGKLRRWLGEVQTHSATKLVKSLADSGAMYISGARWRQNGDKIRFQIPGPRYNKGWGALFEVVGNAPMPKSVGKGASAAVPPTLKPGDVVEFITSDSQADWAGLDKGLSPLAFHPTYTAAGNIVGQVKGAFFTLTAYS